mgnify:CR=1 FL=1
MNDINEILIGACDVYMYEFTGAEVPENTVIETDEHNVGHCSSGFTVDYKPTKYDVKNQYGQIVKSAVTEEAICRCCQQESIQRTEKGPRENSCLPGRERLLKQS